MLRLKENFHNSFKKTMTDFKSHTDFREYKIIQVFEAKVIF